MLALSLAGSRGHHAGGDFVPAASGWAERMRWLEPLLDPSLETLRSESTVRAGLNDGFSTADFACGQGPRL